MDHDATLREIAYSVSGAEIKAAGLQVLVYSDLRKFSNITDLFLWSEHRPIVLLYETGSGPVNNVQGGHWCCLAPPAPGGNTFRFVDSYGLGPDFEFTMIAAYGKRYGPLLSNMLKGHAVEHLEHELQKFAPVVDTCGRYAMLFGRWAELQLSPGHITEWVKDMGFSPDDVRNGKNDALAVVLTRPLVKTIR